MPITGDWDQRITRRTLLRTRDNQRGYVRCSLTREAWMSEFRVVQTKERGIPGFTLATAVIENGQAGAVVARA